MELTQTAELNCQAQPNSPIQPPLLQCLGCPAALYRCPAGACLIWHAWPYSRVGVTTSSCFKGALLAISFLHPACFTGLHYRVSSDICPSGQQSVAPALGPPSAPLRNSLLLVFSVPRCRFLGCACSRGVHPPAPSLCCCSTTRCPSNCSHFPQALPCSGLPLVFSRRSPPSREDPLIAPITHTHTYTYTHNREENSLPQ